MDEDRDHRRDRYAPVKKEKQCSRNPGKEERKIVQKCLGDNIHRTGVCTVTGGASGSLSSQAWANSDPGPLQPLTGGPQQDNQFHERGLSCLARLASNSQFFCLCFLSTV